MSFAGYCMHHVLYSNRNFISLVSSVVLYITDIPLAELRTLLNSGNPGTYLLVSIFLFRL